MLLLLLLLAAVLHDNDNNDAGDDCFGANVGNDAAYDAWVLQCVLQCPWRLKKQHDMFSACLKPRSKGSQSFQ